MLCNLARIQMFICRGECFVEFCYFILDSPSNRSDKLVYHSKHMEGMEDRNE